MAGREWFLTKVMGSVVLLVTIVSICVGASTIVVDLKNDVVDVEDRVEKHIVSNDLKFLKVEDDMDNVKDTIHLLELQATRTETNQKEIMRRITELENTLKTELGYMLKELKRLEVAE